MRIRARLIVKNYELEERRKQKGYTQADMADCVGIQTSRYQEIENLKVKPNEEEATNIAIELGANINILFPNGYEKIIDVFENYHDVTIDYTPPVIGTPDEQLLLEQLDASFTAKKMLEKAPLSKKELTVIKLLNGIGDNNPRTLEQVGKEIGVTRERIRQIEAKASEKIRAYNRELISSYKD